MNGAPSTRLRRIALCGVALVVASAGPVGLRGIVSESMPRGLYRSETFGGALRRGDTVEVCLPASAAGLARERKYLSAGIFCPDGVQRIVKSVLALPGDTVVITQAGFVVNGAILPNTRALTHDSRGRALHPVPVGRYPVRPGTMWLFSTQVPNSYDSRYYGPVSQSALRRRYHPLWTERHREIPVVFSRR